MFESTGIIQYFNSSQYKLWLLIDDSIGQYYRSLIPEKINKPKYPAHISIYRGDNIPDENKWAVHEGREIKFQYGNDIFNDGIYWWLEAKCNELEKIRIELGLPATDKITCSPDEKHSWHITIANSK